MSPNRLINEKSPYLRQHAFNPVDWYPWCEEAFEKAKLENKPIFLSIGYSTCHWCHVMEKESFENEEIAEILNRFFISIKVDREERPDIDSIYMKSCYLFQDRGGWPLSVFMTADKKPFFVDTYIPRDDMYGKLGFKNVLLRISELWNKNREKITEVSQGATEALKKFLNKSEAETELSEMTIHKAFEGLRIVYDIQFGGFGKAPKFPLPLNMLFLHRYFYRYKDKIALQISLETLKKMRMGGIYDHIGFGFHRYSTDRQWIIPHFEKMLYDNALLMLAYTEAYQITRDEFFKRVTEEIATYLKRDMYSPEGAFYSAEDADSEGKEGEFYLWTYNQIENTLSKAEFELFKRLYPITTEGNYCEEATGKRKGKNILYLNNSLEELAEALKTEINELTERIESIRKKLFTIRQKRAKPLRDEKILTDWNALAIVAFCRAGVGFENKEYIETAQKAIEFILSKMFDKEGRLLHRYFEGEASIYGYLEDYAYLIWALMELYFATLESLYLLKAINLCEFVIENFRDKKRGGFYSIADYAEVVIERTKEIYDGVTPSGNSVMIYNLIRLARLIGKNQYEKLAIDTLKVFSSEIDKVPSNYIFSALPLDLIFKGTEKLAVVTENITEDDKEFLRKLQKQFLPSFLPLLKDFINESISEEIKKLKTLEGKTTYFLCKNYSCEPPTTDKTAIENAIISA
jgi:uncharacterized protein YyaL (SSP411 family)